MNRIRGLLLLKRDTGAASSAEYALLLAIVGSGLAVAAIAFGGSVSCSIGASGDRIANAKSKNTPDYGNSDPQGQAKGHRPSC